VGLCYNNANKEAILYPGKLSNIFLERESVLIGRIS